MISSTARDLPRHRTEVMHACLRQGFFPVMMEHLPATDEALSASLKMVESAHIYLGIIAYRYGTVPSGHEISITEMEYNRALERKIAHPMFLIHPTHLIKGSNVETGLGATKLEAFKERLRSENVVNFFKSPADLRAQVINTLSRLREPNPSPFHYVSDIPEPPAPYVAHPYTLLQAGRLIGRQPELNHLTEWIAKRDNPVLSVVAIGGMGKSALTWHWFNNIATQEMKPLAGRLWWSFYESDATFENFLIRALAYVLNRPRQEVQWIPPLQREEQLLTALNREPYLIVLDGIERVLIAYARKDAAYLPEEEAGLADHFMRKAADFRVGAFLRKLSATRVARVLISTRLYPADLEDRLTGDPMHGSGKLDLTGLSDDDAINLWRAFGVKGARDALLPVFRSLEKHPLMIQALAGEIKRDRRAALVFENWRRAHPSFNPMVLANVREAGTHVLQFALRELSEKDQQALQTMAAFRMPVSYDTLAGVLVGIAKPFVDEAALDTSLTDLEDRGLLGWDGRTNRYDLHPVVRSVVWGQTQESSKREAYESLHKHLSTFPAVRSDRIKQIEDLAPTIELYCALVGLKRYDDAFSLFANRLSDATLYRLGAIGQYVELLEMLFPKSPDWAPQLRSPETQSYALNALALGYKFCGHPGRAVPLFRHANGIDESEHESSNRCIGLGNLSDTLRICGNLRESELIACEALALASDRCDDFQQAASLIYLGRTVAVTGRALTATLFFQTARQMLADQDHLAGASISMDLAELALWRGDSDAAWVFADQAWNAIHRLHDQSHLVRAARLQGLAAFHRGDLEVAEQKLNFAAARARETNLMTDGLPASISLATLRRRRGEHEAARELLEGLWEPCERGPYPMFHAAALNELWKIELDTGNEEAAVHAVMKAFRLAWCDGPPYTFHWALKEAREQLKAFGFSEPEDLRSSRLAERPLLGTGSKYEPMPRIAVDPNEMIEVLNQMVSDTQAANEAASVQHRRVLGTWMGPSGRLDLESGEENYSIQGHYDWNGFSASGKIRGHVNGPVVEFRWTWDKGPEGGNGFFICDEDGTALLGGWFYDKDEIDLSQVRHRSSRVAAFLNPWIFTRVFV